MHRITTDSPAKNHVLHTTFSETTLKKHEQNRPFRPRNHAQYFSENLSRILRKIPHAEHVEILQPSLQHIDQSIISIGIRRPQKEARLQHKILSIADDSFNHLAIVEVHPYPQTRHGRRMLMKMQCSVAKVSIEGLDEEDRLGVLRRHIFDSP